MPIGDFNRPGVSTIVVSGQSGNAPANLSVGVRLVCPNRGQLGVELVSPGGQLYQLKPINFGDNAPNLNATYTVNGSFSPANGTWSLRVRAFNFNPNNGFIDGWSLTF